VQVIPDGASLLAPALYASTVYVTMEAQTATVFFMQTPTMLPSMPGLKEALAAVGTALVQTPDGAMLTLYAPAVAKVTMGHAELLRLRNVIDEVIGKHERKEVTKMDIPLPKSGHE
jgi:hypothetical protein